MIPHRLCALFVLLSACGPVPDDVEGLLGAGWADPFPSAHHVTDGHLDLDVDALPEMPSGNPLPVDRLRWREGFSPAQTSVLRLPGLDAAALPDWRDPTPGEGGVLLVDLDEGRFLPVMAELDAWPGLDDAARSLLVRPLEAMTPGHRVAVVITTEAAPRPERFTQLLSRRPPESLAELSEHYQALMDELEALGLAPDAVAFAWDFPVGDAAAPMRSAIAQVHPTGAFSLDTVRDAPEDLPPLTYRAATGSYTVTDLLLDDRLLDIQGDGSVQPTGEVEAYLYAHVPDSVRNAPAGSVPVMIFGHGIFSQPSAYLDDADDPSGLLELADRFGVIVVATRWRGLTTPDLGGALEVANDFAQFPILGDRLVQAVANNAALTELILDGALLDDPVFQGEAGQALAERGRVIYYGISLGGIEGATLMGQGLPIEAGVLHVGGSTWSTMLERSSNWPLFEDILTEELTDPWERQVLYSLSQLYWDPADPINHVEGLRDATVLWQESFGDEQVPNLTTRTLVRSVGVPQMAPIVEGSYGVEVVDGPLPPGSSAYTQFDPMKALPPEGNRPAPVTGAHYGPRTWPGTHSQIIDFLTEGQEGSVTHHCGDAPCSADNRGQ
ncbi:MAG: hypothetical protein H6741_29430 [Alphaproteobacteria bacterium]|nr:hypothetical protein [Alphaproteobacteria bacterium]MCB9796843.1 hypothetical protein [Alphaproteobacteria bacterium]